MKMSWDVLGFPGVIRLIVSVDTGKRQFTDKTVHRQGFWRQFTDGIEDSTPTLLKTVHRHFCFMAMGLRLINIMDNYE